MFTARGCKIGCLGGVVALVAVIVFFVRWWTAPIDIPRPQRPPDPADNAYEVYRSLAAYTAQMFRTDSWLAYAERELFPSRREVRTDQSELSRYLLQKMLPIRQEYRRYLHKPCVVIAEYSLAWQFPELAEFRRWASVEALDIALASQEGDYARAIDDYRSLLLLAEQIRYQGFILHHITGTTMQAIVTLQMSIALPYLPAGACDQLVRVVREWSQKHVPPVQILPSERGLFLSVLHDLYARKFASRRAFMDYGVAMRWDPRWLNLRQAAHEGEAYFRQIEQEWQKPVIHQRRVPQPRHRIAALLLPELSVLPRRTAYTEARIRLLACSAAVRAYRLRHDTYPTTLQEAGVADLARDPFTGKQFVYKATKQGFLLYSVGEDGRDDGGWRASERAGMNAHGDVTLVPYLGKPIGVRGYADDKGEPVWFR